MLCSFCEGTENSPLPDALLFEGPRPSSAQAEPDTCHDCGHTLWSACAGCIGLGKKLKIVGSCSRCGRSIPYWQTCTICQGSGRIYAAAHDCAPRKKAVEKTITKAQADHARQQHASHSRRPSV